MLFNNIVSVFEKQVGWRCRCPDKCLPDLQKRNFRIGIKKSPQLSQDEGGGDARLQCVQQELHHPSFVEGTH